MDKEALKRIFKFLEEKGEHRMPLKFKLLNNIPLTKEELIVDDDLNLSYTNITSLPEGLKVGGSLLLSGCKNITSLPEGLKVGGDLFLSSLKITSLPEGLKVGDNLYISNTKLKKHTDDELREMIKPGFIKGEIYR